MEVKVQLEEHALDKGRNECARGDKKIVCARQCHSPHSFGTPIRHIGSHWEFLLQRHLICLLKLCHFLSTWIPPEEAKTLETN